MDVPDLEGTDVFTITAESVMSPTLTVKYANGTTHATIVGGVHAVMDGHTQSGVPGATLEFPFMVENN